MRVGGSDTSLVTEWHSPLHLQRSVIQDSRGENKGVAFLCPLLNEFVRAMGGRGIVSNVCRLRYGDYNFMLGSL